MVVFSHSPSTLVSDIFHAQTDCSIEAIHTPGRLNITADDILGAGPNWFTCSRSNISFTYSGASRASGPPASGILSKGLPRPSVVEPGAMQPLSLIHIPPREDPALWHQKSSFSEQSHCHRKTSKLQIPEASH